MHQQRQSKRVTKRGLASFQATLGMEIARTTLMAATPPRPGQHPAHRRRGGPHQSCEQMAHFRDRQGKHGMSGGSGRSRGHSSGGGASSGGTNSGQIGKRQQDQGDVPVPPEETAHFVVVQPQIFGVFKILLNGLITNDKFCMSRTARLQLSWWRLPRSARQTNSQGVQSPVEENVQEYLPQQETYEKTTMERSAQLRGTA